MPYRDPEKRKASRAASYDPAAQRQRYLNWKASRPDALWAQWLKAAHGMLPGQWFAMWDAQGGRCYLCEEPLPENRSEIVVDHDHSHCGKKRSCGHCQRGLAHDRCNLLLAAFGEDVALMRRAFAVFADNFERAQALTQAVLLTAPEQPALWEASEVS